MVWCAMGAAGASANLGASVLVLVLVLRCGLKGAQGSGFLEAGTRLPGVALQWAGQHGYLQRGELTPQESAPEDNRSARLDGRLGQQVPVTDSPGKVREAMVVC